MSEGLEIKARVGISGVIEMRDKDGNLIKSVPFEGQADMSDECEDKKEAENG